MTLVTCHTADCLNSGAPIDLNLSYVDTDTGETKTVDSVVCGVCGQPITDITEQEES